MAAEITDSQPKDAAPPPTAMAADIWASLSKGQDNKIAVQDGRGAARGGRSASGGGSGSSSDGHAAGAGSAPARGGILPGLTITDGQDSIADSGPIPFQSKKEWTVAINLAIAAPDGRGGEVIMPQLKALADDTKNKSVNFLVQNERLVGADGVLATSEDSAENSHRINSGLETHNTVDERYLIHDGKIDRLPDQDGMPAGADLTELVQIAQMIAPSAKLGLVIDSHGGGAGGLGLNSGHLSLGDTTDSIKMALNGGWHPKLDLLDFDSCDMGQTAVLKSAQSVAKDVVASQGVEFMSADHDGQNLKAAMEALLQNPKMSGHELGDTIVNQVTAGEDGTGKKNSIPTLANFDLTKYSKFEQQLNNFGAALNTIDSDPKNMELLHQQIELTAKPETAPVEMLDSNKDLRSFVEGVEADSQNHKFSGDTKTLDAAAKNLLASMDVMVTAKYGEKERALGQTGGIDTPLPGSEILNGEVVNREINPINILAEKIDSLAGSDAKSMRMSAQETLVNEAEFWLGTSEKQEEGKPNLQLQQIRSDLNNASSADNENSLRSAVFKLQTDVHAAQRGELGAEVGDSVKDRVGRVQKYFADNKQESVGPDWDEFVRRVQAGAK